MLLVFPSQKGFVLVFNRKFRRTQRSTPADSPANLPNPTHRFCYGAPFPIAHIEVARRRKQEKRPSAEGELSDLMERQIEKCRVAKSRVPAMRKKRPCVDRLVDADYILNAEDL